MIKLDQRTCNIIMVCKNACYYANNQADTLVDKVKVYTGKECWYDWHDYTESQIENVLFTALENYIDGVKKPSFVLWELRNIYNRRVLGYQKSLSESICVLFQVTQIRDSDNDFMYINGFTEELINKSIEELGNIEFAS